MVWFQALMTKNRVNSMSRFIPYKAIIVLGILSLTVPSIALAASMVNSKHDLSNLNARAIAKGGVPAMEGRTYNDYGDVCVYCHTPHNFNGIATSNVAPAWNRALPQTGNYSPYASSTVDTHIGQPDGESLACLSCHDGTIAVDSVHNPPARGWTDAGVHYKMNAESCGKCHGGSSGTHGTVAGAHDATVKYIGQDLRGAHPVSMNYPSGSQDRQFNVPGPNGVFSTGVKLFFGKVQCPSCHDPHFSDENNAEGRNPFLRAPNRGSALCVTCHIK